MPKSLQSACPPERSAAPLRVRGGPTTWPALANMEDTSTDPPQLSQTTTTRVSPQPMQPPSYLVSCLQVLRATHCCSQAACPSGQALIAGVPSCPSRADAMNDALSISLL